MKNQNEKNIGTGMIFSCDCIFLTSYLKSNSIQSYYKINISTKKLICLWKQPYNGE